MGLFILILIILLGFVMILGPFLYDYLNFGLREKPIIVQFEDGTYGIRKRVGNSYYFLNKKLWLHEYDNGKKSDMNFWWSTEYKDTYCRMKSYDEVLKRWEERNLAEEDFKEKPDIGKPLDKFSKHVIKEFRGVDIDNIKGGK